LPICPPRRQVAGYDGAIAFDTSRPDGTPRKLLDVPGSLRSSAQPAGLLRSAGDRGGPQRAHWYEGAINQHTLGPD